MKLYDDLKELVEFNDAFYVSDQTDGEDHYEIFLYRLASYTDFQEAGAVEARGIMFLNGVCVSRPMEKFWNLGECSQWPEHKDTVWEEYTQCMVKEDGSLISTWVDTSGNLRCKSKGSLWSDQAIMAQEFLDDNPFFKDTLKEIANDGYTVNMELVSPDNRIVLSYPETDLVILNIRNTITGEYLSKRDAKIRYNVDSWWVEYVNGIDMEEVPSLNGQDGEVIEGFIYEHPETGHKVKCKTDRYVEIHHAKDDVNNPKRLMMCVLEEGSDDLRSLFDNDILTIKYIDTFENMVFEKYNSIVKVVELYHKNNDDLTQKEYAVKAQEMIVPSKYFSLIMMAYNGKEIKYKEFMIKNRKTLFPDIKWSVD